MSIARISTPEKFQHVGDCTKTELKRWVGKLGDQMLKCPRCGSMAKLEEPTPQPVPVTSRHYCRDHGNPVTWTGTGCTDCETERAEREARGRRKTTGDELEEWER